jgi:hypothetical protein
MFAPPPRLHLELDRTPSAPRVARDALRSIDDHHGHRLDDVLLATSELVANALVHTHGAMRLSAWSAAPDRWRVEVDDVDCHTSAVRVRPALPGWHGWGLRILDAVVTRWGVDETEEGKRCWFEIDDDLPPLGRVPGAS